MIQKYNKQISVSLSPKVLQLVDFVMVNSFLKEKSSRETKTSLMSAPLKEVLGRSLRPLSVQLGVTFTPGSFLFLAGGTGVTKLLMTGRQ